MPVLCCDQHRMFGMTIRAIFFFLCLFCGVAAAAPGDDAAVPEALRDWRGWALRDHEYLACPFLAAQMPQSADNHVCAWPGRLTVSAQADHADFAVQWRVDAPSWVALPGDTQHWPQQVTVNGQLHPVLVHNDAPSLWLTQGSFDIAGSIVWQARPQSLRVPDSIGLISLNVDGKPVAPVQRDGAEITLGRGETATSAADSLDVRVFRKLADGIPAKLTTEIRLVASGQPREEVLGPALPEGLVATSLAGQWPARLDGDGRLRVQVRPGVTTLTLQARTMAPLNELSARLPAAPWPRQEIWSYEAAPQLRATLVRGAISIDPRQSEVPEGWRALPAYVLGDADTLRVEERSRGQAPDEANRLTLHREAWLDFSGAGWFARDAITGNMKRDWRFDVVAPFALERAQSGGDPLLVTRGAAPESSGVEWREPKVDLRASVHINAVSDLPVTGWRQAFDQVETVLHLPFGYRLLGALGADNIRGSWMSHWSLLDVFVAAILVLLAWRLLGLIGAALATTYVLLGYQEAVSPFLALLAVLALGLVARVLPAGKLGRAVEWLRRAAWAALVLTALPFAAGQVRCALYPQLEGAEQSAAFEDARMDHFQMGPSLVRGAPSSLSEDKLAKPKRTKMEYYGQTNALQTGAGEPQWQLGSVARLSWSGPVMSTQTVRLLIAPPWLVRPLRLVLVVSLALLAWFAWRDWRGPNGQQRKPATDDGHNGGLVRNGVIAALMLVVGLTATTNARAQNFASDELLQQLQTHLTQAPKCAPACASISQARITANDGTVTVVLDVSAGARIAMPIPAADVGAEIMSIKVDAAADAPLARVPENGESDTTARTPRQASRGNDWIALDRGVHRVEIAYAVFGDRFTLNFPLKPMRVVFDGKDWEAGGIEDARLLADTLTLSHARQVGIGHRPVDGTIAQQFPPYVRVVRTLVLGLDFSVATTVERISPASGGFTVGVPLLPGEHVSTAGIKVQTENGRGAVAMIAFGDDSRAASFDSTLNKTEVLTLTAPPLTDHAEEWRVQISPIWHVEFNGVPVAAPDSADAASHEHVARFYPLPGEALTLKISRPESVQGPTRAIDSVTVSHEFGQRAAMQTLTLRFRASQGGEHTITLPAGAEVIAVSRDGEALGLRAQDGKLTLPLKPGAQRYEIRFRSSDAPGLLARTPALALGLPAANINLSTRLPGNRWLLASFGPAVGPAVLYWGELLVVIVVALVLARTRRTQLKFHDWLLLGLGFSTFSWAALMVVAVWLFAFSWRARADMPAQPMRYNALQVGLVALTVLAVMCLVLAIPHGLLGRPDMHVIGNGSTASTLRWFTDRSTGALPQATVISVPLWVYKTLMLLWALWLANAVVRWLRDAFAAWTRGGYWMPGKPARTTPPPFVPPC